MPFEGVPSSVILPGVDLEQCRGGDGTRGRKAFEIPDDAQVISMFARVVPRRVRPTSSTVWAGWRRATPICTA